MVLMPIGKRLGMNRQATVPRYWEASAIFANMLDEKAGIDIFKQRPILTEAVKTSAEYLFPNRMIAGFGDTHPGYLNTGGIDNILKYATRHKNKNLISGDESS